MAMLAEPKRRKKWTLNPRGTLWSKDDSNVGHKLLEKMGWSKGKGLGREEQGDLEPIRLKYKNDAEGVGYEAKDDQWVAHREQFNQILESLNGEKPSDEVTDTPSVQSLEARSKNSRARVHYHKFTRGKDLSRYSASDLASILGKRSTTNSEDKPEPKQEEEPVPDSNGTVQHLHGVTTIHGGSIQEYFAAKMAAVKESRLQNSANYESQQENAEHYEENEKRVRINEDLNVVKEFCSKQKILDLNWKETPEEEADEGQRKKKKKSKNKLKEETKSSSSNGTSGVGEQTDDLLKTQNPAKDQCDHTAHTETDNAGSVKEKKEKKSKKRKMDENDPPIIADNECTAEEPKKKKKQKSKTSEEGSTVEMTCKEPVVEHPISTNGGAVDCLQDMETSVKKSKKGKKHRKPDNTENTEINSDMANNTQEMPSQEICETPKKKQKKSSKHEETEPATVQDTLEVAEKPKKKKKKSEKRDEELPVTTDSGINECEPKDSNESEKVEPLELAETTNGEVKKSKKKKKKNKEVEEVQEKYTRIDDSFIEMDSSRVAAPKGEKTKDAESEQIKDAKKNPEVLSAQSPKAIISNEFEEQPAKEKKLSNKEKQKHKLQQFQQFKGSNILDIVGYPAWEN